MPNVNSGGGGGVKLLSSLHVAFNTPNITTGIVLATIPAGVLYIGAYVTVQTAWDADPDAAQLQLSAQPSGLELGAWTVAANWATGGVTNASTPQILGSINAPTTGFSLADQTRYFRDTSAWTLRVQALQVAGATMGEATITPLSLG